MSNNLYTLAAIGATFRPKKNMITLFNGTGSGKVLKVWKVWILNNQSVAITGIISEMRLYRITSTGGGSALTPVKHNYSVPSLPSQVVAAEGATNLLSTMFRRLVWSTEEPVATASNSNVIELVPRWNRLWETSIDQTNLEPIVLNEGQGVCVYFATTSSVGQADFFMEFTAV